MCIRDSTQLDAELKRGWSEELLWTRLIEEAPDLFACLLYTSRCV